MYSDLLDRTSESHVPPCRPTAPFPRIFQSGNRFNLEFTMRRKIITAMATCPRAIRDELAILAFPRPVNIPIARQHVGSKVCKINFENLFVVYTSRLRNEFAPLIHRTIVHFTNLCTISLDVRKLAFFLCTSSLNPTA